MRKCIRALISLVLALVMITPVALPVAADSSYGFIDFPTGWSAPAMAHAVANGIIYGKTENTIAPGDNLTRAEMGTIINRAFGATIGKDISAFSDVSASAWYYEEIKKSYNMQTMYGDEGGTMRPDAPIIREEAIAIVARAMVLSGYSASELNKFNDKAEVAGWAVDPVASMVANGYVNGDDKSNLNPKAYITREEFAQLIYNIIKHYYNKDAKSESYQGNLMLNKPDISLENITVNGDLILGDGVGTSKITLTNIDIKGRLLVRGAAQITLKNVTTAKGVVVKNVNGTVHFDNYRDEKVFDGVVEHTTVTYKQRATGGGGGGGGGGGTPPAPTTAGYKVEHYQEALDGSFVIFETDVLSGTVNSSVTAVAKAYEGFAEDATNASRVPTGIVATDGTLVLKLYYTRNSYNIVYNLGEAGTDVVLSLKYGANVSLEAPTVTAPAGKYFAGWFDAPVGGNQIISLTVPANGTTIYAQWSTTPPAVVNFTVEHYKENVDGTYSSPAETETLSATVATVVKAQDYDKTYTDFDVDLTASVDVAVAADGSTVLKIYYTRKSYNIVYNFGEAGGSTTVSLKFEADVDLSTPAVTAPAGKYFAGWFDAPVGGNLITTLTVPSGGTTIYAQWSTTPTTIVNFTVKHHQQNILDDLYPANPFETETKSIAAGSTVKAQDYAKTYTGFTADLANSPDVTVAADGSTVLNIYYVRNTYTITYNYGEAGGEGSVTLKYGAAVDLSAPPVVAPSGKTFAGWFDAPVGGNQITDLTVPENGKTIYAQWSDISPVNFTVRHFQQNIEDDLYPSIAFEEETKSAIPGFVAKAQDYAKAYTDFTAVLANSPDVTVEANGSTILNIYYTRNTYTITYNYGEAGGEGSVTLKFGADVDLSAPAVTAPAGKYFAGWFDAPVGGTQIGSLTMPSGGATIYAQWSDIPPVNFTVRHFQQNIEDDLYPSIAFEEETKSAIPGATVSAARFDKSYAGFTADLINSPDVTVEANGSTILNIYYTRNTYTITYNYGEAGGEGSVTLKYGAAVDLSAPAVTAPADKTFAGWFDAPVGGNQVSSLTVPVNGKTIYAQWSDIPPVNFTVRHFQQNIEDDLYPSVAFEEETKSAIPGHTVRAIDFAKTYEGFATDLANSPDVTVEANGNTVLNIYYVRNTYTITYNYGEAGGEGSVTLKYGAAIDLSAPTVTAPAGKYFAGWYDAPVGGNQVSSLTVPVNGTTIYAQWSDNPTYMVYHYKADLDGNYPDNLLVISTIPAEYGAQITATPGNFEGFHENTTHPDRVTSGINDGTLVLKLFYDRNTYTVSFDAGQGTAVSDVEYKYEQPFGSVVSTREYYILDGWYKDLNDPASKVEDYHKAGREFTGGTLYAKWEIDRAAIGDVVFTASVTDEDLDNDEFSILVDLSNNLIGISEYGLTLNWDNTQVKPILVGGKVVTDLNGLGGNAITTSADSVTTEDGAAALSSVTVNWNSVAPVAGNANLFKVRFKITNTLADKDHETPSLNMFRMMRAANIDGLMDLPFTITSVSVSIISETGEVIPLDNSTKDTGLAPYKIEHYKENTEDTAYSLAYTEYGHDIVGKVVFISEGKAEYIAEGFIYEEGKSANKIVITESGAVIKLYYARPRFDVEFDYQGATRVEGPASVSLKLGATIKNHFPEENSFAKDDYNFGGWFTQPEGKGQNAGDGLVVPKGGIKLYANWVQTPYKVEHYQMALDGVNAKLVATDTGYAKAGTTVTATAKTYLGFDAPSVMPSEKVAADGSTVIKVYYTRKTYTINYNFDGGTAVGAYETTFKYGQSIPLAKAEKEEDDVEYQLIGWRANSETGPVVTNTSNIDHILRTLTDDVLNLYAWWVPVTASTSKYVVEHYKEELDGTYPEAATETTEVQSIQIPATLKVSELKKPYEGFTVDEAKSKDLPITEEGFFTLKIYYTRNEYTLNYDYCDADVSGVASNKFKYGQTITLPEEGTYSKEGFIPTGWYKTDVYIPSSLVDESTKIEEIVNISTSDEATIYVKWDQFFTVIFNERGNLRHTSKVYPKVSDTVPQADIDYAYGELINPYVLGYRKDASVSSIYAENPYEHKLYGNWYYYEDGKYILFTDETVVNKDLTVRYMFRKAGLELNIEKISQIIEPIFEVTFEEDTRILDTLKDAAFLFEEKLLAAYGALDAGEKFNKVNDKLVDLLTDKGIAVVPGRIFADDGEILKQHVAFNAFSYLEEEQLKKSLVEVVKKTLKDDPSKLIDIIDGMLKEKDENVIQMMDDMLVSMLSGSDSQRIKDIIAESVEKAVANDTTGEFKEQIKGIIIAQLDAGNTTVESSVKDAVTDYFMNKGNDEAIRKIVGDLINQAFATQDENDPIRKFIKTYITDYLNTEAGSKVLDDMIRDLGENLDPDSDEAKPVIKLIHDVLAGNIQYLEEIVDGVIADLNHLEGTEIYNVITEAITEELMSNEEELKMMVEAIGDVDVTDFLTEFMADDYAFKTIVETVVAEQTVFESIISTSLNNDEVFETLITQLSGDATFFNMMVDVAISNNALINSVKGTIINDDEALVKVIKSAAQNDQIKQEIIDKLLSDTTSGGTIEEILKGGIAGTSYYDEALATAKTKVAGMIKNILAGGIDENSEYWTYVETKVQEQIDAEVAKIKADLADGIDETSEYWPYVEQTVKEQVEAKKAEIKADLANGIDEFSIYWPYVEQTVEDQIAAKEAEIKAELANGIDENSQYWNYIYPNVKEKADAEIENVLTAGIDETDTYWNAVYQAVLEQAQDYITAGIIDENDVKTALNNGLSSDPMFADMSAEIIVSAKEKADEEIKGVLQNPIDENSEYWTYVETKVQEQIDEKEAEIKGVLANGIDETNTEYWPLIEPKINEKVEEVKADIKADLANGIEEGSDYWNEIYPKAVEEAEKEVEKVLTYGMAKDHPYWNQIYDAVKEYIEDSVVTDFDSQLDNAMADPVLKEKIKQWASDEIADETSSIRGFLANYIKGLGAANATKEEKALKDTIIASVVNYVKDDKTTDAEINSLITSITAQLNANADLKASVVDKTIEILSKKDEQTQKIKETVISSVVAEISKDKDIKGRLIDKLVEKITGENADATLKNKVIDAALYTVVHHEAANNKAIELINDFIETDEEFKEEIIGHVVDYVLTNDEVRKEAMEKVVAMIEDPNDTSHKQEAIDFAFEYLGTNETKRNEVVESFLSNILNDNDQRKDLATQVIDIMFGDKTLRNQILDIGFEQMFSNKDTIKEIVKLAIDELIKDNDVRREMILAVIETEDGRKSILDILREEIARDDTFLDKIVDLALESQYGDIVDLFVYDLVNNGKIQINPDNRQIVEEIVLPMLDEITLDTVMSKLPAKVTDVLPQGKIEEIFNKFKSEVTGQITEGIEEAKQGNSKDIKVMIDNDFDIVNTILIPAYNKVFPRVTDKAEDFYYYGENQYIRAIVDMLDPEVIFDHSQPASEMGTGYRVRDSRYYYEMIRNTLVLADDAGQWYLDNISDEQIDKVIAKFMDAYTKVITKVNSLAGGRIPEDKLATIISYVEKAIDKRQSAYDVATHKAVEGAEKVANKVIAFVEEKIGTALSEDTIVEIVINGSGLTLNDNKEFNIDDHKIDINVKGYSFKVNSQSVTVAGKTVDISKFVKKIADKFGANPVTIRFCKNAPYAYSVSVGNNSVKVSAFYEG